ncbi:ATP synthase subunit b [Rosistilla carotiformis]|uniref:ATP synthase subunit b n=1 Tax=Rosistilla carotiformis TaxID=2528017 RepID=A0A518JYD3_9BACT|nr:F0F1 ATP synthase subunit B [Rosistilla carotiformis]QDV70552.1 ATP synthase subunit b [Rosistilla carotiformis]
MKLIRSSCLTALWLTLAMAIVAPAACMAADEPAAKAEAASDHESHGHDDSDHEQGHAETPFLLKADPGAALWNLAIFAVVFLVLTKFIWPPILEGLQAREAKIHDDLTDAERARSTANAMLSEYQTKLDDAQTQVQSMLAEARRDAEQSKQSIIDEAKAEANRQRDRAVAEIQSAKTVAIGELASHSSSIALQLARQVVGRELNESDHADLIRKSLDNLPSNN